MEKIIQNKNLLKKNQMNSHPIPGDCFFYSEIDIPSSSEIDL